MKGIVCAFDDDTYFFEIVAKVLQGDTFASYMLIICQDYVNQPKQPLMDSSLLGIFYISVIS